MAVIDPYDWQARDDPSDEQPPPPPPTPQPPVNLVKYTGGGTPPPRAPAGVPQDWFDDFLRRNPGDAGRAASAYAPTSHRTYDSQNPTSAPANFNTGLSAAYHGVFNDPLTKQYEQLLQQQMGLYQQQQAAMQQQAQEAAQRRSATGAAADRLTQFINKRVTGLQAPDPAASEVDQLLKFLDARATRLQGPAYTGTEQEILRTQMLDPIERDRAAARKRALENIGARGFDPSSGIAQQLLLDVDRGFDESRTLAQRSVSQRQIEEQRSREQEAQQILDYLPGVRRTQADQRRNREQEAQSLLQYLHQLPDATARGDLDFVNYVQGLINQPGAQTLTTGQILADLPTKRLNDALATLGMSPSMSGAGSNSIQLLQQLQNQRYMQQRQWADYFGSIGSSFQP